MVLSDWVNKKYLDKTWLDKALKAYKTAKPYPHVLLKDFFVKAKLKELEDALSRQEFIRKESDLFSFSQTDDLEFSNDNAIREFHDLRCSREFKEWLYSVTDFLSYSGSVDIFGSIYADSDYLLPHDDRLDDRKIAYILYLTTLRANQAGKLSLYTNKGKHPGKKAKGYVPTKNSFLLFSVSEKSWHEVEEVRNGYRVSVGGWFHE